MIVRHVVSEVSQEAEGIYSPHFRVFPFLCFPHLFFPYSIRWGETNLTAVMNLLKDASCRVFHVNIQMSIFYPYLRPHNNQPCKLLWLIRLDHRSGAHACNYLPTVCSLAQQSYTGITFNTKKKFAWVHLYIDDAHGTRYKQESKETSTISFYLPQSWCVPVPQPPKPRNQQLIPVSIRQGPHLFISALPSLAISSFVVDPHQNDHSSLLRYDSDR